MTDPTFAARLTELATDFGDAAALSFLDQTLTFAELEGRANRLARHFVELGVRTDDFVTIAEPNSVENIVASFACWKVGATPQPVSSRLPRLELEAIVDLADPAVVIGAEVAGRTCLPVGFRPPEDLDDGPLDPSAAAAAWKAPTSGGSTGRPKLIVSGDPSVYHGGLSGLGEIIGAQRGATTVMPGPMYHNGPYIWTYLSLLAGSHVVLLPRFDAVATLDAVQTHRARAIYLVPTMMQRIWKLPEEERLAYDVSSLQVAFHLAEPCPPWLKEIDWIGPDALWELYGGTEGQAFTVLNGREWLAHRGSVGKPITGEITIRDTDGSQLPAGQVGDVWLRWVDRDTPTYRYLGAEAETLDDGWECLGDMGWMDADGYLYLTDRRKDMILVGGANIYPAEVEAALNAHEAIASSAVIGLPDEERGNRVHAIVEADAATLDLEGLKAFLGERLVPYKIPRTYEFVTEPVRDDAGKVRRAQLRAERASET